MEKDKIIIFGREDSGGEEDRGGILEKLQEWRYGSSEIDPEQLKTRLNKFLSAMSSVVETVPNTFGEFALDSVTLTAEISAKGQVSLLGTGGELAGKGGLTFTLKRKPKN
ncbi:MAG: hypothetical protein SF097_26100 [Acidobacteriota bacterium]|nr:hypothetical protein [Acidobacteriota bacterium]